MADQVEDVPMPRWLVPALAVSVLVLLAVGAKPILLPAGNARLTRENFDQTKERISREEVESILGQPDSIEVTPDEEILTWEGGWARFTIRFYRVNEWKATQWASEEPAPVLFNLLRWRWNRWLELGR